jgi:hypothetical protein
VLRGWARLGVLVEFFGILNLFGNFIPALISLIKSIPVVGPAITPIREQHKIMSLRYHLDMAYFLMCS